MDSETDRILEPGSIRALSVGDRAPGFDLRWTFDENVTLEGLLTDGPVVLAFYVFDFGHV